MIWTTDQPIVAISDVHKSFGPVEVLKGVSLDVRKGEVICIIGPSDRSGGPDAVCGLRVGGCDGAAGAHGPGLLPVPLPRMRQAAQ